MQIFQQNNLLFVCPCTRRRHANNHASKGRVGETSWVQIQLLEHAFKNKVYCSSLIKLQYTQKFGELIHSTCLLPQ